MGQCTAKSKRSRQQCRNWAIRHRTTCRMHGGRAKGPRTVAGKERARHAVLKHGGYTKEALAEHKEVMQAIKTCKNTLRYVWKP